MKKHFWIALSLVSLAFGCSQDSGKYRSALTGQACEPDSETMMEDGDAPKKAKEYCKANNGHGNNEDGVDSSNPGQGGGGPNGEVDPSCDGTGDCIDDEIKGGGDGECELPVGCDEALCCEVDPADDVDDDDADDGSDDGDDGSDDGSDGADDGSDGADDGSTGGDSCAQTCSSDADCGNEGVCVDDCCEVMVE